jgi:hypothetical protein
MTVSASIKPFGKGWQRSQLDVGVRADQGVKDQQGEQPADDQAVARCGPAATVRRRGVGEARLRASSQSRYHRPAPFCCAAWLDHQRADRPLSAVPAFPRARWHLNFFVAIGPGQLQTMGSGSNFCMCA